MLGKTTRIDLSPVQEHLPCVGPARLEDTRLENARLKNTPLENTPLENNGTASIV